VVVFGSVDPSSSVAEASKKSGELGSGPHGFRARVEFKTGVLLFEQAGIEQF